MTQKNDNMNLACEIFDAMVEKVSMYHPMVWSELEPVRRHIRSCTEILRQSCGIEPGDKNWNRLFDHSAEIFFQNRAHDIRIISSYNYNSYKSKIKNFTLNVATNEYPFWDDGSFKSFSKEKEETAVEKD